ncbi:MAG: nucleotidyltransferase family protein [Candidatus Marinimicrobia bacterium]|nr:nucleotidyltransferase family protein [Candidatus Neomarinimicrobiota bacterium]
MIEGVILAAGFSQRAEAFKPALLLNGKPLIRHCIDSMRSVCDRIIIVGGHAFETLRDLCVGDSDLLLVFNEKYELGMFSSVQCGLRAVKGEKFFLVPGDQPVVKPDTFRQMLKAEGTLIVPRYKGKKGHPVLFTSSHIPGILSLPENSILRDYIHSRDVTLLDVDDPGIGMDVDNPDDLKKIQTYIREMTP